MAQRGEARALHRWSVSEIPVMLRHSDGGHMGKDSRDIIREIEADGWRLVATSGSHHHFKHPTKPGKVTVPHPRKDLHPKTVRSIYRQAGLEERR